MEYQQFLTDIKDCIRWKVSDDYEVKINHVTKNNAVELDGLVLFREDYNISPNIYLNQYYGRVQEGECVEDLADEILNVYYTAMENQQVKEFELELSLEKMKTGIIYRLVNYEQNRKVLMEVPHIRFLDLAITFHYLAKQDEEGIGTVRITNELLKQWGISVRELYLIANENTVRLFPPNISTMDEVIEGILRSDLRKMFDYQTLSEEENQVEEESMDVLISQMLADMREHSSDITMYILSNTAGINGASVMIYKNVIRDFACQKNHDFYILPSSIHEVILVAYDESMSREELRKMVNEVNTTQVPEEEVLSDKVYLYKRDTNRIEF